jgi:hypothetical protein
LTVGVVGDYGAAYAGGASFSNEQAVANLIKSWNPDFIITTGDNNYPNGEASNIDTNIGQFFHEYIYPYDAIDKHRQHRPHRDPVPFLPRAKLALNPRRTCGCNHQGPRRCA